MEPIYLDYNATTPVDPRVAREICRVLEEEPGNPSSAHPLGRRARGLVDEARARVAALLGAFSDEVIFTGGGTEANNLTLKGVTAALRARGDHVVTTSVEHPAVLEPCRWLERQGLRVTRLPVDDVGLVSPRALEEALSDETVLVSIMHANNETGAIMPVAELARVAKARGALFHTDAAQSAGKVPLDVAALGVDLLTLAGHKLYAPKGVGALYVRRGTPLEPLLHGAGHEGGRRAGTENVPYLVGLGLACELAREHLRGGGARQLEELRDRLEALLRSGLAPAELRLNGPRRERLPNTLNVSFPDVAGDALLRAADGIAASTGSACHEDQVTLSPVLAAMGLSPEQGRGAVRLSLGRETTAAEVEEGASRLLAAWRAARAA